MEEENVLNPALYKQLLATFGDVRIANHGVPFEGTVTLNDLTPTGRPKVKIQTSGEYYCVCCNVCGDTRYRLWINHRWGTLLGGVRLDHLVTCYNEDCDQALGFKSRLRDALDHNLTLQSST
ncbi:unnamed protein product, partial [marine sediment metagenome]